MTELESPKTTDKTPRIARLLTILIQPRRTFAALAGESGTSWLSPMLALSLSALLSTAVGGYVKAQAALMGNAPLPPDWQYWTPDMQNNYMQGQQSMQGPVFVYILPIVGALLGLWFGWLVLGGILHLGSTLLGGRGSMSGALNVAAWAWMPFLLRDLLRAIYMPMAGHAIVSAGLSGFAPNAVFLAQIFSRVDIFFLWSAILLVIGLGAADGLSRGKSAAAVLVVLLLLLLAQAGIGTLSAGIGGMVAGNPLF